MPKYQISQEFLEQTCRNINRNFKEGNCYWAAFETARILFRVIQGSENLSPELDMQNIKTYQDEEFKKQVKAHRSDKKIMESKSDFIRALNELKTNTVLIVGNSEGDHYYNVFKADDGRVWVIDSDRQVYFPFDFTNPNFTHTVKGWKRDETDFDYFYCSFTDEIQMDEDCNPELNVYYMKESLLDANVELKESKSAVNIRELQSNFKELFNDPSVNIAIERINKLISTEREYKINLSYDIKNMSEVDQAKFKLITERLAGSFPMKEVETGSKREIELIIPPQKIDEFKWVIDLLIHRQSGFQPKKS